MAETAPQCQAMSVLGVIDSIIERKEVEIRKLRALKEVLPKPLPKDVEELLWQVLTFAKSNASL